MANEIDSKKGSGLSNMTLGLIVAAVVELLLMSALIAYIIIKSRDDDDSDSSCVEMDEEVMGTVGLDPTATITHDNALFTMSTMMEDDPFAQDFEDAPPNEAFYADLNSPNA
ncbi:hypothetical protein TVAG_175570 [Trichomonas vaginalis G3]|uniref:Uncharacterized protein n=1 Tax=Trichomonas vaginalis (strain ATCC PRA-98 / G3) TaxID=412133 RepID=A2F5M5_TRIV3|nr:leucine-rich repeats (6 copies)-containing protein [Trichomonas vaginalis G3]EAX99788.1 hypothetical protein TVAG_175570 [Trichomonas vaginalis G3]KAI5494422.1 leucine-rich repeats (6 copies)-containing protein [Trichomonas vaginalis G3]|eukprot:XP_001312718.1 hypothetical protein [Trichomonas vaginalis G3]